MSPKGEGAGRKPLPEGELKKPRSFKATDEEWELIKRYAQETGLTVSEYIRYRAMRHRIPNKAGG